MHSRALASLYLSIQRVIRGLTGIKHTYIRPDPLFPAYAYRHPFSIGLSLKKKKKTRKSGLTQKTNERKRWWRGGEREKKKTNTSKRILCLFLPSLYALSLLLLCSARGAASPRRSIWSLPFSGRFCLAGVSLRHPQLRSLPEPYDREVFLPRFYQSSTLRDQGRRRAAGWRETYIYICMYVRIVYTRFVCSSFALPFFFLSGRCVTLRLECCWSTMNTEEIVLFFSLWIFFIRGGVTLLLLFLLFFV